MPNTSHNSASPASATNVTIATAGLPQLPGDQTPTPHRENNASVLAGLQPRPIWEYFHQLIAIPRPSGQEQRVLKFLADWADSHGFDRQNDAVGNLAVRVPASANAQHRPVVALQSHVDIVVANRSNRPPGVDAARGIIPVVRAHYEGEQCEPSSDGDWIVAPYTTLGADDGIGVAAAMAIATDPQVSHGPLVLLFTVNEETGLGGANSLDPALTGDAEFLINLDSEDERSIIIGCAGAVDTLAAWNCQKEASPVNWVESSIEISGLIGGHSGLEIHQGRANATVLVTRLLLSLSEKLTVRLVELTGGERRNVIPRTAFCSFISPPDASETIRQTVAIFQQTIRKQYEGLDPQISFRLTTNSSADGCLAFPQSDSRQLLSMLMALPSGVVSVTPGLPGLIESSNNLAVVSTDGNHVHIRCCSRSSSAIALEELLQRIQSVAGLTKSPVEILNRYSGWKPSLRSPLLEVCTRAYRDVFDQLPEVTAVHAGLEVGAILAGRSDIEAISLGPNVKGNHAPGERLQISSVDRFYRVLAATLAGIERSITGKY